MKKVREQWKSRFGFIMATAGFAVGVGNIWRFPYIVGENGGGAFILLYVVLSILIGIPLLTAEISLGRASRYTPVRGLMTLRTTESKNWARLAWLSVITCQMIMGYYIVIMAWVLHYVVVMASGYFSSLSPEEQPTYFADLQDQPALVLLYCALIAICLGFTIAQGLQKGVERISRKLLPALLVLMIALVIAGLFLDNADKGLRWYLSFDLSKLSPRAFLFALGQVLFSIGVGMAVGFTYGSYLDKQKSDIVGNTAWVVAIDVLVAILAGFLIFPALFSFGFEPTAGPGLLFITMASLFSKIPAGNLIGALFFALVLLAGYTSIIGLTEGVVATLRDSMGISRKKATWLTLFITLCLATPSALSTGFFAKLDFLSGNLLLPLNALLICFYVLFVWGFKRFKQETNTGAKRLKVTAIWAFSIKILIPVVILVVLYMGLVG